MIIFIYGEDSYRSRQKLNEILAHFKDANKSNSNLQYLDGKSLDFQSFKDGVFQSSLFGGKKLTIIADVFSNVAFKEGFVRNAKIFDNIRDVIVFFEDHDIGKKDSFLEAIEKTGKVQQFNLLKGSLLKKWVEEELKKNEMMIDPLALEKLVIFIGNDPWRMISELGKLTALKSGEPSSRKKILSQDVERMVKPKVEADIFKTIDSISLKNKKQAIGLLHKHLEKEDSPLYLLSMISYQFRNLLVVRDLIDRGKPYQSISKITKLHPFVVSKSYAQAQSFTYQELKKIYQKILKIDLEIKSGRIEPETALDILIAEI